MKNQPIRTILSPLNQGEKSLTKALQFLDLTASVNPGPYIQVYNKENQSVGYVLGEKTLVIYS